MIAQGRVFKYGDNVDTDVIIPARYLNTQDHAELASHCMEDIDINFAKRLSVVTLSLVVIILDVVRQGNTLL